MTHERNPRRTCALLVLAALLALGPVACVGSGPPPESAAAATDPAGSAASADDALPADPPAAPPASTERPPADLVPPRMSDPLPPRRLPAPVALDRSCRTDADCTIKDVGNCCGAYPSCVNVDSPTDPDAVQAQCEAQGMASVCGFPEVSGCTCVAGQCEDVTGPAAVAE